MSERAKESVWDYPRPPRVEPEARRVRVEHGGETLADSTRALRVLETASPPTIYIPREDVRTELLSEAPGEHTVCEWKGRAQYLHAEAGGERAASAAWHYPDPRDDFAQLSGHIAFYAGRVDACYLGDEHVRPQGGGFYGGWVSDEIEGPYKGEPGTEGW
ncbi:MAG: DUF427 domain-containing protein [Actinomycetota bacterium]|nr:DUF427 domain-containing protein [Actinomycetota bacterium]